MIIIDTNVISEMMKQPPNQQVLDWLNTQKSVTIFTTTITVAELRAGIEVLPDSKRKFGLFQRFDETLHLFTDRIIPFETSSAFAFGELMRQARAAGRAISFQDGLIAAVAKDKTFAVASRDISPFQAAGIETINPWQTHTN